LLTGGDWLAWIYKALVLLVIACPCALVISTPVTVVSGLAAAARQGILIKGGVWLEQGRKLRTWHWTRPAPLPMASRNRPPGRHWTRHAAPAAAWRPAWPAAPTIRSPAPCCVPPSKTA
jgi:hypothetical protein